MPYKVLTKSFNCKFLTLMLLVENISWVLDFVNKNLDVIPYSFNLVIMKIALASPPFPKSISDGLYWVEKLIKDAVKQHAEIICFPESYVPSYPGMEFEPEERFCNSSLTLLKPVMFLFCKRRCSGCVINRKLFTATVMRNGAMPLPN
jgi:hypothetical protein